MRTFSTGATLITLALGLSASCAWAQDMPSTENGRFAFSTAGDSVLRLDTRSGQVSQCQKRDGGWACQVVPDERAALESEIGRLQGENARLKKELLARGAPLPGVPQPEATPEVRLPSDADVDRVMSFFEKVWRRLIDMVQRVQKDYQSKS